MIWLLYALLHFIKLLVIQLFGLSTIIGLTHPIVTFSIFFPHILKNWNKVTCQKIHFSNVNNSLIFSTHDCATTITNPRTLLSPCKETPHPLAVSVYPSSSPDHGKHYFLSVWICLFWTFHLNRIIKSKLFLIWVLSLHMMFSRFANVVACISTSLLCTDE